MVPSMKVIPISTVALICVAFLYAASVTSGLEINVPGVATIQVQVIKDGDNATTPLADGGGAEIEKTTPSSEEKTDEPSSGEEQTSTTQKTTENTSPTSTILNSSPITKEESLKETETTTSVNVKGTTSSDEKEKDAQNNKVASQKDEKNEPTTTVVTSTTIKPTTTTKAAAVSENGSTKPAASIATHNQKMKAISTTSVTTTNTTPEPNSDEDEDDDLEMDDDIWGGIPNAPDEFGKEYDLQPKQIKNTSCIVGQFSPQLNMPPNLLQDMFYRAQADNPMQSPTGGVQGWFKNMVGSLRDLLTPGYLKEQLDSLPGTIRSIVDTFRQKKSEAIQQMRKKMDEASEKVGTEIQEKLAAHDVCNERAKKCLGEVKESFKKYEHELHNKINRCVEKAKNVIAQHESKISPLIEKSNVTLEDMQICADKLLSSSVTSLVSSIFNAGSCTKKLMQQKMKNTVQPMLEELSKKVQHQAQNIQTTMAKVNECVDRKIAINEMQNSKDSLINDYEKCMQETK